MYEVKKNKRGRSIALRLFVGIPWTVRAFFHLFLLVAFFLFAFGLAGHLFRIPAFEAVAANLVEALKLVTGAVIGALSAEAKIGVDRFKDLKRE